MNLLRFHMNLILNETALQHRLGISCGDVSLMTTWHVTRPCILITQMLIKVFYNTIIDLSRNVTIFYMDTTRMLIGIFLGSEDTSLTT